MLTLPVLAALHRAYPQTKLSILANRQVAALALNAVPLTDLRFLDDAQFTPLFSREGTKTIRPFHPDDLVISYLHDPDKVFERNVRACGVKNFYTGPSKIVASSHATEQLAQPLQFLGISIGDFAPRLNISQEARREAEQKIGAPVTIVVHPASGGRRKNWPITKWIDLISDFLNRGIRIAIVGGEADHGEIAQLQQQFGTDAVAFAVDWPLPQLAALLTHRIFIGHDSGISHLAAATGARSLILFGPTDPEVWAPKNVNARILVAPERNLDQLSLATVRDALDQELIRIGINT